MDKNYSFPQSVLLSARAFSYTASVSSVILGLAISFYAGHTIKWGLFFVTLLGVVLFHTAANLINDSFDRTRGLDSEVFPTSGGVVRGILTPKAALVWGFALIAIGTACGLYLTYTAGWPVLLLGVTGALLVIGYTRSGLCLKYAGLGDAAIFIAFGFLPVFGTYWVQAQTFSWTPILWSLPAVSCTVGILHANNWRDIGSDSEKKCRTFANIMGANASKFYYQFLIIFPFLIVGIYLLLNIFTHTVAPWTALVLVAALPPAIKLFRSVSVSGNCSLAALDGQTAQLQLIVGLLLAVAFFTGRLFV